MKAVLKRKLAAGRKRAEIIQSYADAPAVNAPQVEGTSPVDEDGNVAAGHLCHNSDCGHAAYAHANTDAGANTGPCGVQGCSCPSMQLDAPQVAEADEGEQAEAAESEALAIEGEPGDIDAAEDAASGESLNQPPPVEGGASMGPAFKIPVAIIEGQPTGDGREILPDALSWREPPMPLMWLNTETHDPEGWDLNDPAVLAGRIDTLGREPGEGGTQLITAEGYFLPNEEGMHAAEIVEAMGRVGVSADVSVGSTEVIISEVDEMGFPLKMEEKLAQGTIMGITACPFPAFEGAYLVLADAQDAEAVAIPQQADGIDLPGSPPAAVAAGGQLIHWMSFEDCEPCGEGIEVIAASGAGPARPPGAWFSDPSFEPGDGRLVEILDRNGGQSSKFACPLTITDDGQVFGHVAAWDICHVGKPGQCITAPHSGVDYAHFKRGQYVTTAEGEKVRVGVITADTGHAPLRGISATSAMAHYDDTSLIAADVNVGEDEFGIWCAGAVRPDATPEQIRKLTASSLSGDWREIGGQLEMVAALAVPMPGFPMAVVQHGELEALTAAGASVVAALKTSAEPEGDTVLRRALAPLLPLAKAQSHERIAKQKALARIRR